MHFFRPDNKSTTKKLLFGLLGTPALDKKIWLFPLNSFNFLTSEIHPLCFQGGEKNIKTLSTLII